MTALRRALAGAVLALATAGCIAGPSPTPTPAPTTPAPSPSPSPSASASVSATPEATPSPTPEPPLSLALPEGADPRVVASSVAPNVGESGGTLTITVTSGATERIDELVVRWPTALETSLRLAPFAPSEQRAGPNSPPLVQAWTKWVVGPGEQGEPDGTMSVGWGPLLPGATLVIELVVTRVAAGPVAFDLQVLAGNDVLTLNDGGPAELRVEVP